MTPGLAVWSVKFAAAAVALRNSARSSLLYGRYAVCPNRVTASPSPSCDVPLISPIAKTGGDCGEDCAGTSATMAPSRLIGCPTCYTSATAAASGAFSTCSSNEPAEPDEHLQVRLPQRSRRPRLHPSGLGSPRRSTELARKSTITGYIGFDCTAPSLHIGSLLPIMLLYWLQQTGHRPIALMGGGTTRVGDPSGKDESRRLLTDDVINANLKGIRAIFAKFLKFEDAGGDAILANNADWLNTLNYIDFLRDIGRHFSINRMLALNSVKLRLERLQELWFLEFNYMILQAYDFVELYRRTGCVLQMGGSDQWGNIVSGIDLGRRLGMAPSCSR